MAVLRRADLALVLVTVVPAFSTWLPGLLMKVN